MKTKERFRITLVLGDDSHDGHNKTERLQILCNLPGPKVQKAYDQGSQLVGFNLTDEVCTEYVENTLPKAHLTKLQEMGFKLLSYDGTEYELGDHEDHPDSFEVESETFANIWMFIAKLGNPQLKYEFVSEERSNTICIGGYGLFDL